jgi:hypothetical protein
VARPRFEVADVLRAYGEEYRRQRPVSVAQLAVMRHIEQCRTAALGGHIDSCDACGKTRVSYNSCRDRHCPKCQSLKKAEWLDERCARLLPVPYWHVVFTIPDALNPLALRNKQLLFDILFMATAQTLQTIARDPRHLGAQIGFTAVLHTWGQNLLFHPHVHCVVTGGGLVDDGTRWVATPEKFFLPVNVLGKLFRGKFLHAFVEARREKRLELAASTAPLACEVPWRALLATLYKKDWVVYAKHPFAGPKQVYQYLGNYTHRVAITNHRILAVADGKVSFKVRAYAEGGRQKILTLDAGEFIRRFLIHVLPKKFVRIRHYGLLAGRNVLTRLPRARALLTRTTSEPSSTPISPRSPWWERLLVLMGIDVFLCPYCKVGRMSRGPLLEPTLLAPAARAP